MKKVDLFITIALIIVCFGNMTVSIIQKNWMGFSGWTVAVIFSVGMLVRQLRQY